MTARAAATLAVAAVSAAVVATFTAATATRAEVGTEDAVLQARVDQVAEAAAAAVSSTGVGCGSLTPAPSSHCATTHPDIARASAHQLTIVTSARSGSTTSIRVHLETGVVQVRTEKAFGNGSRQTHRVALRGVDTAASSLRYFTAAGEPLVPVAGGLDPAALGRVGAIELTVSAQGPGGSVTASQWLPVRPAVGGEQ